MDDDATDYFQKKFVQSGNPLHLQTSQTLSRYFHVQNQPPFYDLDEKKSREGDIIAKETFPKLSGSGKHFVAQLILTIECKSLPDHGWIFIEDKIKQNFLFFSLLRTQNNIEQHLIPSVPLVEMPGTSSFFESILPSTTGQRGRGNSQTNNIHDSSMKVIKLTKHSIDEDKKRAKILYRCYNNVSKAIFF